MVSGPVELMMADRRGLDPASRRVLTTTADRRLNAGENRLKVRRSLFGPRIPGDGADFVRKEAEASLERDCRKWNFDFQTETPFASTENQRWQWSKIEGPFNKDNTLTSDQIVIQSPSGSGATPNTRLNDHSAKETNVVRKNSGPLTKESFIAIREKKYQMTTMHDYMKVRKRNVSSTSKREASTTTTSSGDSEVGSSDETSAKIRKVTLSSSN